MPVLQTEGSSAEVVYTGPVQAPVAKGTELAQLLVTSPELGTQSFPLVAETDVPHGGFMARISTAAKALIDLINQGPAAAS